MTSHMKGAGRSAALALGASLLGASPAAAHGFGAHDAGLRAGLLHPFQGVDHLLALVAVGLLAFQAVRGRRLRVPAAFVAATAGGFALALAGAGAPFLEAGLLVSVLALGALVAAGGEAGAPALAAVAVFGALHGLAHGAELLGSPSVLAAGAGMALATAALHATGFAAGAVLARARGRALVRASGVAVAAAGLAMGLLA